MGEHLRAIFQNCGQVLYLKMSADQKDMSSLSNYSNESKYAFIEFASREAAKRAFHLHGTPLGDRPMKIGKATSPIFKNNANSLTDNKLIQNFKELSKVASILTNPARLSNAMTHVKCALGKITERVQKKKVRKRRRYRSRSRSRSRSSSRSRTKSRKRKRSNYTNKSRSKNRGKSIWSNNKREEKKRPEMVWDGFQWHPKESKEGQLTTKSLQKRVAGGGEIEPGGAINQVAYSCGGQTALELAQLAIANISKRRH